MEKILVIDLNKCFECGGPMEEMHHVVPVSRGGKKTMPLCNSCHGKAHGIGDREGHSRLTKEGLARAKARGVKMGTNNLTQAGAELSASRRRGQAEKDNHQATKIIVRLRDNGRTYKSISDELNADNYTTSVGGKWSEQTVRRMYKRATN